MKPLMIFKTKTIKWKLFINYFLLFTLFIFSMLFYQSQHEKQFRIAHLENKLDAFTELTDRYITQKNLQKSGKFGILDSLKLIIPPEITRITVFDLEGKVLYDNSVPDYAQMENHSGRPEFQSARSSVSGYNIRHSTTTGHEYFYYARKFDNNLIVRSAIIYDIQIRNYLKIERAIILFYLLLFTLFGLLLRMITNRLGDSITKLKDFAIRVRNGQSAGEDQEFSDDELGVISREISNLFEQSRVVKAELLLEKEKLISHLFVLNEGVAFFSSQKKVILNNSHFVFYINQISEESSISIEKIFLLDEFSEINTFIDKALSNINPDPLSDLQRMECSVQRNGSYFLIQCIIFQDKSFEILITDNTKLVKRSMMKQQITSNIAHELKTPISTVKGYLETLLNNPDLEQPKRHHFIEKAFHQSERLTQLVNDIALLNKIEESSELYPRSKIVIKKLVEEVIESFTDPIRLKSIVIAEDIDKNVTINANYSLIFSVFRNLIENSLNYAGKGVTIHISNYHEDETYHYFTFSDNGPGVAEEHLPRIFERFYRVDTGRTRKRGGTGLGLAIVRNAIVSFKGEISARTLKGGGLEFIFSLPK
jgi:two-component system OmpR family sensor kinase/two-component system phosphate regulon sensor histidine kinase PhoR